MPFGSPPASDFRVDIGAAECDFYARNGYLRSVKGNHATASGEAGQLLETQCPSAHPQRVIFGSTSAPPNATSTPATATSEALRATTQPLRAKRVSSWRPNALRLTPSE